MKFYQIVTAKYNPKTTELGDETLIYGGANFARAKQALIKALLDYSHLSEFDKQRTKVEGRMYDIDDDVDIEDEDELTYALVECLGYNDIILEDSDLQDGGYEHLTVSELLTGEKKANIKDLRAATGMSQADFAAFFNIPKDSIQNWEQGRRSCPDYVLELIEYKLKQEDLI